MGNNTWVNAIDPFSSARGAAVNIFTIAKDVSPTPLKYTYGSELKVGTMVQLEAVGEFSTTGTPTFRLGFAYGITSAGGLLSTGIELAGSALAATGSGAAAWPWHLNYFGIVTAEGASGTGTIYGSGTLELGSSLTAMGVTAIPVTAAARQLTTFDTTAKKTWHVFAEFGTSSGSNQVRVDYFNVKIENQGKIAQ